MDSRRRAGRLDFLLEALGSTERQKRNQADNRGKGARSVIGLMTEDHDVKTVAPSRVHRAVSAKANALSDQFRELARFWPVVMNLASQELRVRYQRSALGFFWTLLHPILMMATLCVVFSQLFGYTIREYAVLLFSGLVPWTFLSNTINECSSCIIQNEGLIRKIYLPKTVFPIARLLINLTTLGLSMAAMFLLLVPIGARPHLSMLALPAAIVIFAAFALGLGLLIVLLNTFYRDVGHMAGVILQAWYFATPILYRLEQVPESARPWFKLNPAYPFIRVFQTLIYDGAWPGTLWVWAAGVAAVSLGTGYVAFKLHEDKMVFRL